MKIEYNPGDTSKGAAAYGTVLPDLYDRAKQYRWRMFIHGISERSQGRIVDLQNIIEGFDFNNDGIRDVGVLTEDTIKSVDLYNTILIVPTYAGFMEPAKINAVYDHARAKYSLTSKFDASGFSLGGGAWIKYITSSEENAKRVNTAVICAPTNAGPGATDKRWLIPSQVGLPLHLFVNDDDTNAQTNIGVTKTIISLFKTGNYTAFRMRGHGGVNEAHTLAAPVAPGGQGVINVAENVYQWGEDVSNNGARPMKTGAVKPSDPPPVDPPPAGTVKAVTSYTITGSTAKLIGSKSTGYKEGYDGTWAFAGGPAGVTARQVFPGGSSYIDATAQLPVKGIYQFDFTLKGAEPVRVTVNYGDVVVPPPPVKTPISFSSVDDKLVFSDGSKEMATAEYVSGKWVVKTISNQTYEL